MLAPTWVPLSDKLTQNLISFNSAKKNLSKKISQETPPIIAFLKKRA
jgi:hypothetical protein